MWDDLHIEWDDLHTTWDGMRRRVLSVTVKNEDEEVLLVALLITDPRVVSQFE